MDWNDFGYYRQLDILYLHIRTTVISNIVDMDHFKLNPFDMCTKPGIYGHGHFQFTINCH